MTKAEEILSKQCNRYVNGLCTSGACLFRANIKDFKDLYWKDATCEYHEAILELRDLIPKEKKYSSVNPPWHEN